MKSPAATIPVCIFAATILSTTFATDTFGQYHTRSVIVRSHPVQSQPIHTSPVYATPSLQHGTHSPPVVTSSAPDPLSVCDCDGTSTGPCNCKNLHCKIVLPHCKTSGPTTKTPIKCDIYGTIPKINHDINCYDWEFDFQHETDVPQIWCTIERCVEIGKKDIQCVPGCSFKVCVPINDCEKKTVECRLVPQPMQMKIYRRKEGNRTVYDVFVINDPDPNSPFHAGGMPAKWLILHCATAEQVRARLPNATKQDGTPIVKSSTKGNSTPNEDANVNIEILVKESILKEYANKLQEESAEKSEPPQAGDNSSDKTVAKVSESQKMTETKG